MCPLGVWKLACACVSDWGLYTYIIQKYELINRKHYLLACDIYERFCVCLGATLRDVVGYLYVVPFLFGGTRRRIALMFWVRIYIQSLIVICPEACIL